MQGRCFYKGKVIIDGNNTLLSKTKQKKNKAKQNIFYKNKKKQNIRQ